jgi:hypothetical protein
MPPALRQPAPGSAAPPGDWTLVEPRCLTRFPKPACSSHKADSKLEWVDCHGKRRRFVPERGETVEVAT